MNKENFSQKNSSGKMNHVKKICIARIEEPVIFILITLLKKKKWGNVT